LHPIVVHVADHPLWSPTHVHERQLGRRSEAGARPRVRGPARLPLSVSVVEGDCRRGLIRGLIRICRSRLRQIARAASRARLYLDDLNTCTLRLPHHVGRFAPAEAIMSDGLCSSNIRRLRWTGLSAQRSICQYGKWWSHPFPEIADHGIRRSGTRLTALPNAVRRIMGSIPRKIDSAPVAACWHRPVHSLRDEWMTQRFSDIPVRPEPIRTDLRRTPKSPCRAICARARTVSLFAS
jgi:hypothetical protein